MINYTLLAKIIFSVALMSWALKTLLEQWRKQHDPEALGNLLMEICDLRILIKKENRKDKDCFLKTLSSLESDITDTETMDKDKFRFYSAEITEIAKSYKFVNTET